MKHKTIFLITVIIIILSGCCEESQYHKIPDEDTMTFKINDTLFFKNEQNFVEKFYVDEIKSIYLSDEEPKYSFCDAPNYYETRITIFRKDVDSINIYYQINQTFNSTNNNHFDEFFWKGFFKTSIVVIPLNNKLVYIYTDGQVNSDNDIEKIWLSYKEGVIQYQYKSGEVFELY